MLELRSKFTFLDRYLTIAIRFLDYKLQILIHTIRKKSVQKVMKVLHCDLFGNNFYRTEIRNLPLPVKYRKNCEPFLKGSH